jgi:hypothetical protein
MMSPNNSQLAPLNFISCICRCMFQNLDHGLRRKPSAHTQAPLIPPDETGIVAPLQL